jgi:hypothetical protein
MYPPQPVSLKNNILSKIIERKHLLPNWFFKKKQKKPKNTLGLGVYLDAIPTVTKHYFLYIKILNV